MTHEPTDLATSRRDHLFAAVRQEKVEKRLSVQHSCVPPPSLFEEHMRFGLLAWEAPVLRRRGSHLRDVMIATAHDGRTIAAKGLPYAKS